MNTRPAPLALALACAAALLGCAGLPAAGEANSQRLVAEDEQVRIEELRVRGQTQALTVQPKIAGVPRYEIRPTPAGQPHAPGRDGTGQRVWPVLSF